MRNKYSINVIALKTENDIDIALNPDDVIDENAKMIVLANKKDINRIK